METQLYKITESSIRDLFEDSDSLFIDHWDEVAKNKHLMALAPDKERYFALEDAGQLVTLIAWAGDEIVGYSCNILSPHLHYKNLMCGYNDVIFVAKEYRNSPLGIKLIKHTEAVLKKYGAKLMLWHAKKDSALDKILPRMKCNIQEIIYSKEL